MNIKYLIAFFIVSLALNLTAQTHFLNKVKNMAKGAMWSTWGVQNPDERVLNKISYFKQSKRLSEKGASYKV